MARRLATAVLTLGCLHSGVVSALGLGELKLESFLNEPLSASVEMHSAAGLHQDQIKVRLATSDDFDKLGIDRAYFLTSIKFEVSVDDRGNGTIILSSEDPVLEPYLDFLIEARWPSGRLLREYTVLVDPPIFDTQSPIISASEKVLETEGGEDTSKKPRSPDANTGTSVSTKKSELAAGEMPQREFGSNASAAPLAGNQYMIRRDETLWAIAKKARPEGTSVHQTMLDIQRMNPDAFIDGNINRIKAGYIVSLPDSGDISSDDLASAEQEVRQQNQDWRDGVPSKGPSLRISAQPDEEGDTASANDSSLAASSRIEDAENLEESERERFELADRLESMEDQVETLQRIVALKDDQISALQNALSDTDSAVIEDLVGIDSQELEAALEESEALAVGDVDVTLADDTLSEAEAVVEPEVSTPVVAAPKDIPKVTPAPEPEKSNLLYYIIGAVLAAALGVFFFLRRRTSEDDWEEEDDIVAGSDDDVFADVTMPDSDVNLNNLDDEMDAIADSVEDDVLGETLDGQDLLSDAVSSEKDSGYGERKNDEYASDEAGDALAEADIYIAYGRYPQAVDLLKTAIDNDPGNPAYREKLIELSAEMGNKAEAQLQYTELVSIGDSSFIARAEQVLRSAGNGSNWFAEMSTPEFDEPAHTSSDSLEILDNLDLTEDTGEVLEADFGELEIELPASDALDDDLDLSGDFSDQNLEGDYEDEDDLVFAEGGSEMSTKLDLARAYLDMGDEDGARQILEEIAADGSAGQKEEAKILLERLD